MAHMQLEVEKQMKKKSPIADMVSVKYLSSYCTICLYHLTVQACCPVYKTHLFYCFIIIVCVYYRSYILLRVKHAVLCIKLTYFTVCVYYQICIHLIQFTYLRERDVAL